jgi:hypothetical protein
MSFNGSTSDLKSDAIAAQAAALLIIDEHARKTFPDKNKYPPEEKKMLIKWWQGYQKGEKSLKTKSNGLPMGIRFRQDKKYYVSCIVWYVLCLCLLSGVGSNQNLHLTALFFLCRRHAVAVQIVNCMLGFLKIKTLP